MSIVKPHENLVRVCFLLIGTLSVVVIYTERGGHEVPVGPTGNPCRHQMSTPRGPTPPGASPPRQPGVRWSRSTLLYSRRSIVARRDRGPGESPSGTVVHVARRNSHGARASTPGLRGRSESSSTAGPRETRWFQCIAAVTVGTESIDSNLKVLWPCLDRLGPHPVSRKKKSKIGLFDSDAKNLNLSHPRQQPTA